MIEGMDQAESQSRRRTWVLRTGILASLLLAIVFVRFGLGPPVRQPIAPGPAIAPRSFEPDYGGITCSQVRRILRDYRARTLSPEEERRVRAHLDECVICQDTLKEIENSLTNQPTPYRALAMKSDTRR